jgi:hypothetical protein
MRRKYFIPVVGLWYHKADNLDLVDRMRAASTFREGLSIFGRWLGPAALVVTYHVLLVTIVLYYSHLLN